VLTFLDARDLLRAAQTCRDWHMLAEDNLLWREKCQEEGVTESLVYGQRSKRKRGGSPWMGGGALGGGCRGGVTSKVPWKSLYMQQLTIERNWRLADRNPKVSRFVNRYLRLRSMIFVKSLQRNKLSHPLIILFFTSFTYCVIRSVRSLPVQQNESVTFLNFR